jgi:CheY-like chemotaxis protein
MRRSLTREGFRVIGAYSGAEALRKVRETRPDAITLDVLLGGMDGRTVLSELKSDPDLADIPIIMVTLVDEKKMGFSLGANGYLVKPVKRDQLLALLSDFCPPAKAQGAGPRWVLVVDDDPANRKSLRKMLQADGWNVREAQNGRQALERMAEGPTELILLDLSMPEMDGFWFIHEMRKSPEWYAIPVVLIAAKDLTQAEQLRLQANIDQVVQKNGYNVDELLHKVGREVTAGVRSGEKKHVQNTAG